MGLGTGVCENKATLEIRDRKGIIGNIHKILENINSKLIGNSSSLETNSLSNLAKLIGNSSSLETNSLSNLAKLIGNSSSLETNSLSNLAKLIGNH